jgi:hypothetical protein
MLKEDFKWFFDAISEIHDARSFQEHILKLTDADTCLVRIGHTRDEPGLKLNACSRLSAGDVEKYLRATNAKRNFRVPIDERDNVPPPSRLWRFIYDKYPDTRTQLQSLVIGATEELMYDLPHEMKKHSLIVMWPNLKQRDAPRTNDDIDYHRISRRNTTTDDMRPYSGVLADEKVVCPLAQESLLRSVRVLGEYHLYGELPISLVSVPVPLVPKPGTPPNQFYSVECAWYGTPIRGKAEGVIKSLILAHNLLLRLDFEMDKSDLFVDILLLATRVKDSDSEVHSPEEWVRNHETFLYTYAHNWCHKGISSAVGTSFFHGGLETLSQLDLNIPNDKLDMAALFVLTSFFMMSEGRCNEIELNDPIEETIQLLSLEHVDYREWFRFLNVFDEAYKQKRYGPDTARISKVSFAQNSLTLYFSNETSVEKLLHFVLHHYHSGGTTKEHQASRLFYRSLIKGHEVPFISVKGKYSELILKGSAGDKEHLRIVFDAENKLISLIANNSD